MVICFALHQNIKVIPLDIMSVVLMWSSMAEVHCIVIQYPSSSWLKHLKIYAALHDTFRKVMEILKGASKKKD